MKKTVITALAFCCASGVAQAKSQLDCIVEGEITRSEAKGLENVVHINFYKAEPYSKNSACHYRGAIKFKQPKGVMLENLPDGAVVQYRYQKDRQDNAIWSFMGASL